MTTTWVVLNNFWSHFDYRRICLDHHRSCFDNHKGRFDNHRSLFGHQRFDHNWADSKIQKKYNCDSYGADEQHGSQVRARKVASCAHCPLAGLALPDWLALFRDDKPNKGHSLTYMVLIPAIPWLVDDLGSLTENGRDHLSEMVQISQKSRCAYKSRVRISEMRMLVRIRAAAADRLGVGAPPLALRHCPIR